MYSPLLLVVLAGAATAFTPSGFEPASTGNLTVVFGNTLATNGKEILKAETASAPRIGTSQKLAGSYTVIMVDPDVPVGNGSTLELLHWMQSGLTSSGNMTTVAGVQMFELVNAKNVSALATYIQPSPPNKVPTTHRYTQLLLNTTNIATNNTAMTELMTFAKSRSPFSAVNVVSQTGLKVLFGNSFNVSNTTLAQSNITKTSGVASAGTASPTGSAGSGSSTSNSSKTNTTSPKSEGGMLTAYDGKGAYIAGLGALAAAVMLL